MSGILVIGNGPASHRLVERLHHHGHPGPVTVLGAEHHPVRHRPLLTSVLAGRLPPEALSTPGPPGATAVHGAVVTRIDRHTRRVRARADGAETTHAYDTLVLATGAAPVVPAIPGVRGPGGGPGPGVTTLRTMEDHTSITGGSVVVLGGGPLGVEAASALALRGIRTTLVCATPHPLAGRLGEECGLLLTERLRQAGVAVVGGRTVVRRSAGHVLLDDGGSLPADTLVLCTGAVPEVAPARGAGLAVHEGVVVDDRLRTSDPHIHAIGDCAEYAGRTVAGIEAAWEQADTLAGLLTGLRTPYRPTPGVFRLRTHVMDVCCVGPSAAFDAPGVRTVDLADRAGGRRARLALRDDRLLAAVLLGLPDAIATVAMLYRQGRPLPSDRLAVLLGTASGPPSTALPRDDAPVCLCNNVARRALADAWRAGARTTEKLAAATGATTSCGSCLTDVAELCTAWQHQGPREPEPAR
ncbi:MULTISPECIES: FAD-dependent oxidoreductase [unclassified Streptomyces]|uniref:FAD-dependent oxidoreductase n=1 Tax=unclassified Streptomyces TaxID=2593676 RepID=UPI0033AC64BE